jgi:diguanylate cyclase (GGDEF)-like protein
MAIGLAIASATSALFLAAMATRVGGATVAQYIDDLGQAIPPLAASVILALTARRSEGRRLRLAWAALASSALAWGIGELAWSFYELALRRDVPFPSVADLGFLAAVPLACAALLLFPSAPSRPTRTFTSLLDAGIVASALFFTSWALVLEPLWHTRGEPALNQAIALAYPVGDVLTVALVVILLVRAPLADRGPLLLIGGALVSIAVADSAFAYFTNNGTYSLGELTDTGWVLGYQVVALAGLHPRSRVMSTPPTDGLPNRDADGWLPLVLPYAPVFVAAGVVAVQFSSRGWLSPVLFWLGLVMAILVLLRQVVTLADNADLNRRLHARVVELEDREVGLTHRALHDHLTGLANRFLFFDRLRHAVALGGRRPRPLAVLYLDIDDFKIVNDSFGHTVGDAVLIEAGKRLLTCVRDADTVARVGGDEFAILLEDSHLAEAVADRVRAIFDLPFDVPDGDAPPETESLTLALGCSLGLAIAGDQPVSADKLMRLADGAMYREKEARKRARA